jgi:hypothetical protein
MLLLAVSAPRRADRVALPVRGPRTRSRSWSCATNSLCYAGRWLAQAARGDVMKRCGAQSGFASNSPPRRAYARLHGASRRSAHSPLETQTLHGRHGPQHTHARTARTIRWLSFAVSALERRSAPLVARSPRWPRLARSVSRGRTFLADGTSLFGDPRPVRPSRSARTSMMVSQPRSGVRGRARPARSGARSGHGGSRLPPPAAAECARRRTEDLTARSPYDVTLG